MTGIRLIVGLGNPGPEYAQTRHNAGAWLVADWARRLGVELRQEARFHGEIARYQSGAHDVRLLLPTTFMNRSGQSVLAVATFFKILPQEILVAHDELDLPPGVARLKVGGGHGGHNGLRDIIATLSQQQGFARLRIGIGHPGQASQVSNFVLQRPPHSEMQLIEQAIDSTLALRERLLTGDFAGVMNQLNGLKTTP